MIEPLLENVFNAQSGPMTITRSTTEFSRMEICLGFIREGDVSAMKKANPSACPVWCPAVGHVFQIFSPTLSNTAMLRGDLRSESRSGVCTVSVRDNGIGFEPRYAASMFGLFKRLHSGEYPGTGLGLAICQRTIERFGGTIWAEGRPGEGAAFFFSLPCEEAIGVDYYFRKPSDLDAFMKLGAVIREVACK